MTDFSFRLYPGSELPQIAVKEENYDDREDLNHRFAQAWLEKFQGFDYGTMTVWLMRGFGLPNLRAYDTFKHSFVWGLETPEGYVIRIEPGLRRVLANEYREAPEQRVPDQNQWSKQDFLNTLKWGGVFEVCALHEDAPPVTPEILGRWLEQFDRPIYVRDMGANVLGGLVEQGLSEEGPGADNVLDGGEALADHPITPRRSRGLGM